MSIKILTKKIKKCKIKLANTYKNKKRPMQESKGLFFSKNLYDKHNEFHLDQHHYKYY